MTDEVRAKYSHAAFAQMLSNRQEPYPTTISMTLAGAGSIITELGYFYFKQPVTGQAQWPGGTVKTYASNLYLVLQQGATFPWTPRAREHRRPTIFSPARLYQPATAGIRCGGSRPCPLGSRLVLHGGLKRVSRLPQ
jgi:hypothetical protein